MDPEQAPFTVGELIEELTALDPDMMVVLAKDFSGSSVSPMLEIGYARYVDNGSGVGELVTPDEEESGDDTVDGDQLPGEPCVVLWPGGVDDEPDKE